MIATDEYIENRMAIAGKQMGENTDNGQLYEFYKGQFLAFREILHPETYGRDAPEPKKEEKEIE